MNKDVINISSEDDITDIINKLRSSKSKVVALIPPADPVILRSSVNFKLIQKTAASANKIPVLITENPSLLKLAQQYSIHVSKNLQSKPYIPSDVADSSDPESKSAQVAEDFIKPATTIPDFDNPASVTTDSEEDTITDDALDDASTETSKINSEDEALDAKKSQKSKKHSSSSWFAKHKIPLIIGSPALILIPGFLAWAIGFSQSVSIKVSIKTTSNNFSENVSFTKDSSKEDSSSGVFYLTEEKYTDSQETQFTATGEKNAGDKAQGNLIVTKYFKDPSSSSYTIPANTMFSLGEKYYLASENTTINWDEDGDSCVNSSDPIDLVRKGCKVSATIPVVAAEPGEAYNVEKDQSSWEIATDGYTLASITNEEISGGTTKIVTIITQDDIDNAIEKLEDSMTDENAKAKLTEGLSDTTFVVESSYVRDATEIKSDHNAGDEAETGTITSSTTFHIYTIDTVRLEEFITAKATLGSDQKIYSITTPFIERFQASGDVYVAKLKTTYNVGPKVTEIEILEKASGRKIGEVKSLLKSINGVNDVDITTNYSWVTRVPTDANKITITIEVVE